jgi:hypothetical protein
VLNGQTADIDVDDDLACKHVTNLVEQRGASQVVGNAEAQIVLLMVTARIIINEEVHTKFLGNQQRMPRLGAHVPSRKRLSRPPGVWVACFVGVFFKTASHRAGSRRWPQATVTTPTRRLAHHCSRQRRGWTIQQHFIVGGTPPAVGRGGVRGVGNQDKGAQMFAPTSSFPPWQRIPQQGASGGEAA